jgi:predicted restriction endonuclease
MNQAAKKSKVGQATISEWIAGKVSPSLENYIKLCRGLGCRPGRELDDFLGIGELKPRTAEDLLGVALSLHPCEQMRLITLLSSHLAESLKEKQPMESLFDNYQAIDINQLDEEVMASNNDNYQVIDINQLDEEVIELDDDNSYIPTSLVTAQERIIKCITQRKGQPQFRTDLLAAYNYRCAITGCDAQEALEAAHIKPYCETGNNNITNGLLLRADIHTLFDLNLIAIEPVEYKIHLALSLKSSSHYNDINDKYLELPKSKNNLPNKDALEWRWKKFNGD